MSETEPLTGSTNGGSKNLSKKDKKMMQKIAAQQKEVALAAHAASTSGSDAPKSYQSLTQEDEHDLESGDADHGHSHSINSSDSHSHSHGSSSHAHSHSPTKDKLSPRSAFARGDAEASRRAHEAKKRASKESEGDKEGGHAGDAGEYLKSIVYGGLDGIITTFATVTSVAGADFNPAVIVVLGISHLFADGISMGMGDYMSSEAESDFTASERAREKWEMDNNMRGEIDEMVELYVKKGISETDSRLIINTLAKYPDAFLDHMMVEELGLMPEAADQGFSPQKAGLVTLLSFMGFGSIPLLPYLFALIPGVHMSTELQLLIACISTVVTLFLLGAFKGKIVQSGRSSWLKSGVLMAANGSFAAAVGFACGYLLSAFMDLPAGAG